MNGHEDAGEPKGCHVARKVPSSIGTGKCGWPANLIIVIMYD